MGTTVNNNTKVNFKPDHILVNGHPANLQTKGPYMDLVKNLYTDIIKNLFSNAKLPFTANWVNVTHYMDKNSIDHVTYTIETNISAMDNPVITIADMDLVLGKYIDWGAFIDSYTSGWEYQIAGFYDYNDKLVIIFKYDI